METIVETLLGIVMFAVAGFIYHIISTTTDFDDTEGWW